MKNCWPSCLRTLPLCDNDFPWCRNRTKTEKAACPLKIFSFPFTTQKYGCFMDYSWMFFLRSSVIHANTYYFMLNSKRLSRFPLTISLKSILSYSFRLFIWHSYSVPLSLKQKKKALKPLHYYYDLIIKANFLSLDFRISHYSCRKLKISRHSP